MTNWIWVFLGLAAPKEGTSLQHQSHIRLWTRPSNLRPHLAPGAVFPWGTHTWSSPAPLRSAHRNPLPDVSFPQLSLFFPPHSLTRIKNEPRLKFCAWMKNQGPDWATSVADPTNLSAASSLGGANFERKFHEGRPNSHKSNDQYFYSYTLALKLQLILNKSSSCKQRLKILRIMKQTNKKDAVICTSVLPTTLPVFLFFKSFEKWMASPNFLVASCR